MSWSSLLVFKAKSGGDNIILIENSLQALGIHCKACRAWRAACLLMPVSITATVKTRLLPCAHEWNGWRQKARGRRKRSKCTGVSSGTPGLWCGHLHCLTYAPRTIQRHSKLSIPHAVPAWLENRRRIKGEGNNNEILWTWWLHKVGTSIEIYCPL